MGKTKNAVRVGAAAFALGLSLAGPQAIGVASADSPDADSASASAAPDPTAARGTAPRRSATERAARVPRSAATAPPVARAALPAVAVEQHNSRPARAAASIARPAALPANPTGRRTRQVSPVVTAVSDSAAIPTPANTVAPVAAFAVALTNSDSVASLPAPPAMAAAGTDLLTQVNAAVTNWFDASANWLATGLPGGPASDLLQGALLLVRRTLFNQIPTIDPVQIKTTVSGQILGTLGAVDPEGDALTYSLTEAPKLGTVQVSPDGTYIYTPGADFSEGDSFSVAVNDGGFNILDPLGNWRPAQATVEVLGAPGGPPEGVVAKPLISRTFTVTNLTSPRQMLIAWNVGKTLTIRTPTTNVPAIGTIINPGESLTFGLAQGALENVEAQADFRPVDAAGAYLPFGPRFEPNPDTGILEFVNGSNDANRGFTVLLATRVQQIGSKWSCTAGQNCDTSGTRTVIFLDRPGTVISLSGAQAKKQADVLDLLCSQGGNPLSCTFKPKSFEELAKTPWKQTSETYTNGGTTTITRTLTESSTQTTSSTLGASITAKATILKIVELSVTASASRTWTSTYTFTDSIQVPIASGQKAWLESRDPITRVTGDFFVTLGNTAWNLYDISFDSPDTTRFRDVVVRCTNASGNCLGELPD